jgi:hypothetical protein
VVEGEGWARGAAVQRILIRTGQAVYWQAGEEHEAGTDTGMVAIVVEGDVLASSQGKVGPGTARGQVATN